MCTYLKDTTIHIAEKDIKCYKVVQLTYEDRVGNTMEGINYKSAYFSYYYEKGKKYHSELPIPLEEQPIYTEGIRTKYINHGFHSFKKLEDAKKECICLRGSKIVECIIPKGSCYYQGFEEYSQFDTEKPCYGLVFSMPSYVSEDIILNDIIPWSFPFNHDDKCILEYTDIYGQYEKIKGEIQYILGYKSNPHVFFRIPYKKTIILVLSMEGEVLGLRSSFLSEMVKEYKVMPTLTKIEEK